MLPATNHDQYRSGPCRGGAAPIAASRTVHTCIDQSQFPARSPDLLPLRANCRGVTASALYSRIAHRMPPIGLSNRRLVHPLPSGRAATNFRRTFTSRGNSDAFNTIHDIARQSSDGSKFHNIRLSVAGFDVRDRDREAEGSAPNSPGEFPRVRGTFQHECS